VCEVFSVSKQMAMEQDGLRFYAQER